MELNNLLSSLKKSATDTKKYLALEIGAESVKSAVWEVAGTKPELVQTGSVEPYDPGKSDDILGAIDASITKATDGISPEPSDTVFSVPDSWLENSTLTKDKKKLLKEISQKLELKALGFVVTLEAIVHFLQIKKGHPPSAIILGITSDEVSVTIVQNGHIQGTHQVGRSDDLGSDVEEGIARFGSISNLPANFILYDGHANLEELKQTLISYNFQDRLPFLHIPKIEHLSPEDAIKAVVITGGGEVIKSVQVDGADNSSQKDTSDSDQQPETPPDLSHEFGFKPAAASDDDSTDTNLEDLDPDEVGNVHPIDDTDDPHQSVDPEDVDPDSPPDPPTTSRFSLPKFSIFPKLSGLRLPRLSGTPILLVIGLIFIALVSASAGLAYWFLPKATVTLYLEPRTIDQDLTFTLDSSIDSVDTAAATIPGRLSDTQVSAEATVPATGEKTVGDAATGNITLYNRTDSVKTFAAGTRLTTDSLAYTLDEDVQIASASTTENADLSITTQPAGIQTSVTAVDIGPEYNLGSGTEFTVANFAKSSFVAMATGDISGGTSRQVTAVSTSDINTLRDQVEAELERKATQEANQNPEDFIAAVILPDQEDNIEEDLSAKAGEEVDQVSLSSTLSVQIMTYKKSDLDQIIQSLVGDSIPSDFTYAPTQSTINIKQVESNSDDSLTITATAAVQISPDLQPADIAATIKGRYPSYTESYFKSLPGFTKVEIDIRPKLPPRLRTFPRVDSNITIEVKAP